MRYGEITGITVGSVKYNNSFVQIPLKNMFCPNGASCLARMDD